MKKNYFYGAMAAFGLLAFSSCSSDDDPVLGQEQEELTGEQVIVLDMQDTDVLSTKSRPLLSTTNQGAEEVTDVKLLIFKVEKDDATQLESQTLLKVIDVPGWDQISKDYNYGRKYSIRLSGKDRIKLGQDGDVATDGQITIIAVGQNEKSVSPAPFTWRSSNVSLPGWTMPKNEENKSWVSTGTAGEGYAPLFTNAVSFGDKSNHFVSEIFSGTSETTPVQLDGGFEAKVLLKRQVAGVLGYFNNIPAFVKTSAATQAGGDNGTAVKYVRLVASNRNNQLDLTTNLGIQTDDATETESSMAETVISGFSTQTDKVDAIYHDSKKNDAYVVYTIDLAQWFKG